VRISDKGARFPESSSLRVIVRSEIQLERFQRKLAFSKTGNVIEMQEQAGDFNEPQELPQAIV
jgi:hypothetical protein